MGRIIFNPPNEYKCRKDWPDDARLQYGSRGTDNKGEAIAFFEAFYQDDFVRGEAATVEEAEADAFHKLSLRRHCQHDFHPSPKSPSTGICSKCQKVVGNMFPSGYHCAVCNKENVRFSVHEHGHLKHLCLQHYCEATIAETQPYLQRVHKAGQAATRYAYSHGVFNLSQSENDLYRTNIQFINCVGDITGHVYKVMLSLYDQKSMGHDAFGIMTNAMDRVIQEIQSSILSLAVQNMKGEAISKQEMQELLTLAGLYLET